MLQIGIIIFAGYNIFFRYNTGSCSTDNVANIAKNWSNHVQIAFIGNVLAYDFKVFSWIRDSFFLLSVQLEIEKEKRNPPDVEDPEPKPEPRQKRKKREKDPSQRTTTGLTESEEDNMQKPLLYAPPEPVKQYAKQIYQLYQPN